MSQGQTVFQRTAKIFAEHLIPETAKSTDYSGIEGELDSILLLADRMLSACQENLDFNSTLVIAEHLSELSTSDKPSKVAEKILEDIEL